MPSSISVDGAGSGPGGAVVDVVVVDSTVVWVPIVVEVVDVATVVVVDGAGASPRVASVVVGEGRVVVVVDDGVAAVNGGTVQPGSVAHAAGS